jgi:cephalosporin hydroxylase
VHALLDRIPVVTLIAANGLEGYARLERAKSQLASAQFAAGSVDLVHIDGNHDRASVERDLALYRPLVKDGGYIVLDDVSWESVRGVYGELCQSAELVEEFHGDGDDFAAFRLRGAPGPRLMGR